MVAQVGSSPHSDDVAPPEVVAALQRVLASDAFARSPRSRDFLAYVTSETLAGRADQLSERTVARRALGRGDHFDGRDDATVRVRGTRVRRSLAAYYEGEGVDDPVRIDVPPGGYVVTVRRHVPGPGPEVPADASVAVVRFDTTGDESRGDLMATVLARQLAEFPGLRVVGPSRRHRAEPAEVASALGVRFVLQGAVDLDGPPSVALLLSDGRDGTVVWSVAETVDPASARGLAALDTWASAIAAQLGDYVGVMARRLEATAPADRPDVEAAGRLAFYRHIASGIGASVQEARIALDEALAAGSTAADVLAMHGFILGVCVRYGASQDADADLRSAESSSRRALQIDPRSPLAYLGLAVVAAERRQFDLARLHAARAADLAPAHPSTLFSAGALIAFSGDWPTGASLMRRSFELNPLHPGYQHVNLALERLLARDPAAALAEASIADGGSGVFGPLCRALALAQLGHDDDARAEMRAALAIEPRVIDDVRLLFSDSLLAQEQYALLEELLDPFRPGGAADVAAGAGRAS